MKKSVGAQPLIFPSPLWVVGTYDSKRKPNAMALAWGGICCSLPPCVSISVQKIRYTYRNLLDREAFTVCVPSVKYAHQADYFGIVSGKDADKFSATGLTPVRGDLVDAPYVKEFSLALECRVVHKLEIGSHTQFIGEVLDVKADDYIIGENGLPDMLKADPIVVGAKTWCYHRLGNYLGQAFSIGKSEHNTEYNPDPK
ncbi:MAG: flavin reductase family protein [Deltaproteobacteria bacterium]|nr:flavin reductase family protein [Deltaproteobacteria bacterium]